MCFSVFQKYSVQFILHNVQYESFIDYAGSFYLTDVYASEVSRLGEVCVADPLPVMSLHCKEGRRPAVFLRFRSAWIRCQWIFHNPPVCPLFKWCVFLKEPGIVFNTLKSSWQFIRLPYLFQRGGILKQFLNKTCNIDFSVGYILTFA
jgi:hypothetical protein